MLRGAYPERRTASVHSQEQRLISTGDVKKGVIIELDGQLMKVLDWTHIKMARGSAQVRMKMQNVRKGDIVERTFQAGTRWPRARVEQRKAQFLYSDGDAYHFMDTENYDQFAIRAAMLGDDARFLKENTDVFVSSHESEVLGVDLPLTVDLRVTQTDPGFAGDTATGAKKAATVETGLVVQVPLFVSDGDVLRIDTRTGEYVTRVQ
jgi:elongation factor P